MKLYYAPGTCALAPHIALEWTGKPYEAERVELGSEEYLKINPMGMVPALKDDGFRIMTQADAILKYIEAKYPEAGLGVAKDPLSQFGLDEALAFLTGDFHPAFWPFFVPDRYTVNRSEGAQNEVREAAYARIDRVMSHLGTLLDGGPHVAGSKRTIADPYAFAMVRWTAHTPKPWQDYPPVKRFMETMLEDSGVQAAMKTQGLS
ncbi:MULTISPECIES: glutathione S-transferase family protein [unclassified Ruegeria]|uniref:glutathione S-transferase family protein n=1 Tax=unclassified Ruegeria TaxID=2625375 RepID=UPI001488BC97|nr:MULTISPECIES: glutathione S-transferase N-terminal domain-containing protein [unclassified Ruegeria]NOD85958.1 glutathione S-transferase [Ruegeria sp. HKCCD6119]